MCIFLRIQPPYACLFYRLSLSLSSLFMSLSRARDRPLAQSLFSLSRPHCCRGSGVLQPTSPSEVPYRCVCRASRRVASRRLFVPDDGTRNRETVATESTHPKTLKSSRGPRRGLRLGSGWLWWGGWRCGQWLRGWWGWKLRGGGCSSRSRRPLRGISLPLTHRGGGVNNSPARVPPSFRLCPALS